MESNPWKDISPKTENLIPPDKVIEKMFLGLRDISSKKVGFMSEKVDFFPEEVTVSSSIEVYASADFAPKIYPHPDFGYNPQEAKSQELFRYRLLLYPSSRQTPKCELFKFKYSIRFYPVTLYVGRNSFNLLKEHMPKKDDLKAKNRIVLEDYITKIIRSESTIELISRLMVL